MKHPLDGARLKVVRAQEHLDSLKDEIGRYLGTEPYEVPVEIKGNIATAAARSAILKVEPPLGLSCILGDCLNNLRASLDYIAWQLAERYCGRSLVIGKDRIYFPICDNKALCTNRLPEFAKYSIPTAAINEIESVQPYNAGYEPLGLLSAFANRDKHVLPLLTIAHVDGVEIHLGGKRQVYGGGGSSSVSVGLHAGRVGGIPKKPTGEVDVEGRVTFFVAFRDPGMPGGGVDWVLESIVKCVANTVPQFERFF